jgi:hypothetical protein
VEQELLTLPEHLCSPRGFSVVRVTRSLVLYVCFVDRCLSFCNKNCLVIGTVHISNKTEYANKESKSY